MTTANARDPAWAGGAIGDGVADDLLPIQAAVDAVSAQGGGVVYLSRGVTGTYRVTAPIILKPRVIIDGGTPYPVTLKLANGANSDVVTGLNFTTLTGKLKATGDYLLGCPEAGLRNIRIDGNRAFNSGGYCVRLWGRALTIDNVVFQNGALGDLVTEFTDCDDFTDSNQRLEGFFRFIKSSNSGGDGWTMRGPHDSVAYGIETYNHAGWGVTLDAVLGSYLGGLRMWETNSFLNVTGDYRTLNSAYLYMHGGTLSGANQGIGFQSSPIGGACKLVNVGMGGRLLGFHLRGAGHQIHSDISNSPPAANSEIVRLDAVNNCDIRLTGFTGDINVGSQCTLINVISETGVNSIKAQVNLGLRAVILNGSLNNSDRVDITTMGAGLAGYLQQLSPGGVLKHDGWAPSLPFSNGVLVPGMVAGLAYSASITPDHPAGPDQLLTVTNGTPFTINSPTNPVTGWPLTFVITNSSGGAMGAITWGASFKLAGAFTNPANTKTRTISFAYAGGFFYETGRAAADI